MLYEDLEPRSVLVFSGRLYLQYTVYSIQYTVYVYVYSRREVKNKKQGKERKGGLGGSVIFPVMSAV